MPLPLRLLAALILGASGLLLGHARAENAPVADSEIPITIQNGSVIVDTTIGAQSAPLTVGDALAIFHIYIIEGDATVIPAQSTPLSPGMTITILERRRITVADGMKSGVPLTATADTIAGALAENGLSLGPLDRVSPSLTASLHDGDAIAITRISEEDRTETVPIPFPVVVKNDDTLAYGEENVISSGKNGSAQEVVHIVSENGAPARRTVLSRTIITGPTPEERVRGTRIVIGKTVEGLASWYRYRGGMFAASTMFPRGTFLRITNLENGRAIIVSVNDYGPTAPGRVIDLDAVAFQKLAPFWSGIVPVRVEEIL